MRRRNQKIPLGPLLVLFGLGCGAAQCVPGTYQAEVRTTHGAAAGAGSTETVVLAEDVDRDSNYVFWMRRGDCVLRGTRKNGYELTLEAGQKCTFGGEKRKLISGEMTAQSKTRATLVWSLEGALAERVEETMDLKKTRGCR